MVIALGGHGGEVGSKPRRLSSLALTVTAPVGVGISMAAVLIFRWGGEYAVRVYSSVAILLLAVFATVCAAVAARSAVGRDRGAWTAMTVALATFAAGDVVWVVHVLAGSSGPFPSLPDFAYLAFTVVAAVALALLPVEPTRQARVRLILDGVTVALCLFLLFWVTSLRHLYENQQADRVTPGLSLLFAVGDLAVLTTAVLVLVRGGTRRRGVLRLLTVAIAAITITHSGYVFLVNAGRFETATLLDLGWAGALIAFAAAALCSRGPESPVPPTRSLHSTSPLWMPYLPFMLAGTVGPLVVMSGLERFIVPVIVVTVCLRQMVAAWENRQLLEAASDQALRDPLTGLANHALFHDRLAVAMANRELDGRSVAVVSLDLDDFKLVNDSLGHPTADAILVRVGARIEAAVRPADTVARVGGDEFVLLLEGPAEAAHLVADRVVAAFDEPFEIDGDSVPMRPSAGMAIASPEEPDLQAEELVKRADIAMYAAKRSRLSGVHTFSSDLTLVDRDLLEWAGGAADRPASGGVAQIRLLGELRRAVDEKALTLVYQPKIDLRTSEIVGLEALLRWPHPEHGVIGPDVFLPLVRQHGLMRPVTELVLDRVLDDLASWVAIGRGVPVAVNMFATFLRDTELPAALSRRLRQRGLAADMLTIEITEDVALNEFGQAAEVLNRVREMGIRVAIDDFGTGYSALSYLRDLPIDEVKLDRHFIASVSRDARAAAVVRAVIGMAVDLRVSVVAEGVEDGETAAWLQDNNCDIAQGYHFAAPLAAPMVPALVEGSTYCS